MDRPETFTYHDDSSYMLGLEALKRNCDLYYYHPDDLTLRGDKVYAYVYPLKFFENQDVKYEVGTPSTMCLHDFDVIFIRQNPPFDMAYITSTYILDLVAQDCMVVNNPFWVRNTSEKMSIFSFPDLIAPTIVTNRKEEVVAFREEHGDIIIKPLYDRAGIGIFFLKKEDKNLNTVLEQMAELRKEPIMVQKYLEGIKDGDCRIVLINGEPIGQIGRFASDDDFRANLHRGGTFKKKELSERDQEICARIKPYLIERDILFAGIDVIGGYLTEINVSSPSTIQEMNQSWGFQIEAMIWDALEERMAAGQKTQKIPA